MSARLFCFGLGYSARALAALLCVRGWHVAGTARSTDPVDGIVPIVFDGTAAMADTSELRQATHVLVSVPPGRDGDPVLRWHAEDLKSAPDLRWVGYLSTTGVYGDRAGGWVDEASPLAANTVRGRRRVAAERAWLATGLPVHLFRLAGIYGPGRNQLETLKAGRAQRIDKPGQVFSRIHVDDIAAVLAASIERPAPGRAYNVCDDEAAAPAEVVAFAAALLGVEPPPLVPFADATMSAMGRSFYADNKRVANERIKTELGVRLRYPTYREGLRTLSRR
ncbi:MAG: SDR family oxidoreductase [Alphaproteobacteria bacterium]